MSEENYSYRLYEMDVLEFSVGQVPPEEIDFKKIKYTVTVETKLNPSAGLIGEFVTVILYLDVKENRLALLKTLLGFEIKDFAQAMKVDKEGDYIIPFKLEAAIRRIAISTTRGVLYAYLSGTYLKNAILPIVPEMLTPIKAQKMKTSTEDDKNKPPS